MKTAQKTDLSLASNFKIALFHLGSGLADVLTTGVWNRIMVADLGFSAAFVGLLTGLRYFLAPIGVLTGRYSDRHSVGGYKRLFWIFLGRAMMAVSTVSLGFTTAELIRLAQGGASPPTPPLLWLALIVSFLLFSLGVAISGSTFLALIYDRAAAHQRGRAVGIVWTFLLIGFALGGVIFSVLLPSDEAAGALGYSADSALFMFLVTAAGLALIWMISLLGEERRAQPSALAAAATQRSLRGDLALVWRSRSLRFFFYYLTLSMLFSFLQDTVLEPFAGEVFSLEASVTNRFAAYWGFTAIVGSFASIGLMRRVQSLTQSALCQVGIAVLLLAYGCFAVSALAELRGLLSPGLIFLGLGLGVWNIGTLGMMMDMSPAGRAGTFLGFWTFCVTIARGAGVTGGGVLRDLALALSGDIAVAYGAVFCVGFGGLLLAWLALRQVNRSEYQADLSADEQRQALFAHSLD